MRSLIGGEHMKSKTIAILVTPGVQVFDVSGPRDVFAEANVQAGSDVYQLHVFGSAPGAIRSSSGESLMPDSVAVTTQMRKSILYWWLGYQTESKLRTTRA
jgi:transcriptional regulator GlxA family with amidase domain